jgi:hypothetical protein
VSPYFYYWMPLRFAAYGESGGRIALLFGALILIAIGTWAFRRGFWIVGWLAVIGAALLAILAMFVGGERRR